MNAMRTLFEEARSGLSRTGERFMRVIRMRTAAAYEPCRLPMPVPLPVRRPRPNWRVMASAMVSMLAALPASAESWHRTSTSIDDALSGGLVEVRVKVEGQSAPLYFRPGDWDKRYVQAFRGRHYTLALRNLTGERIGVAIAVDGLNVVSGERTALASNEAMYVLDPWQRTEIRGWRTSLQSVRQFVFVDEERSYASRTDQENGDMGWIRVNAFREWRPMVWGPPIKRLYGDNGVPVPPPSVDERARRDLAEPRSQSQNGARQNEAPEGAEKLYTPAPAPNANAFPGTGWGDKRNDPVQRVDFRAEREATDRLTFRYEYASGLRALGIDFRTRGNRLWEREGGELGFAKPPRW